MSSQYDDSEADEPALQWGDFPPESQPELERLVETVARDEWWNWPEAIAWVGSRDLRNIATLRFWPTHWRASGGQNDDTTTTLELIAREYCDSPTTVKAELVAAIERGGIGTLGRAMPDAPAAPLVAHLWRGGHVDHSNGGCRLVSKRSPLRAWAYDIAVSRADLMTHFPGSLSSASAMTVPLPAVLPGIGPVMGLEEALCWLACGRPSNDIQVWQNSVGELSLRNADGEPLLPVPSGELPLTMVQYREASRALHTAMLDGTLLAYVTPSGTAAAFIPRLYWNSVNPDAPDLVYRGMDSSRLGAGCPVLLERGAFNKWRASVEEQKSPQRSTANAERECSEWLQASFASDSERRRSKASFQEEAIQHFDGRLSVRGFVRVWGAIAPLENRSRPGRKS